MAHITTTPQSSVAIHISALERRAEKVDLTDSERRAFFRNWVARHFQSCFLYVIRDVAFTLGATTPPRTRDAASRAIADLLIAKHTEAR